MVVTHLKNIMDVSLLFLIFLFNSANGGAYVPYVPGNPGGEWSLSEMLAVKHLLHQIMRHPEDALKDVTDRGPLSFLDGDMFNGEEIFDRYDKELGDSDLKDAVLPDVPKLVRLAFHDCLPDSETGGCNGYERYFNRHSCFGGI